MWLWSLIFVHVYRYTMPTLVERLSWLFLGLGVEKQTMFAHPFPLGETVGSPAECLGLEAHKLWEVQWPEPHFDRCAEGRSRLQRFWLEWTCRSDKSHYQHKADGWHYPLSKEQEWDKFGYVVRDRPCFQISSSNPILLDFEMCFLHWIELKALGVARTKFDSVYMFKMDWWMLWKTIWRLRRRTCFLEVASHSNEIHVRFVRYALILEHQ